MTRFLPYMYYAYGSNLSLAQMKQRCPRAEPFGPFGIRGWELEFCGRGVANARWVGGNAYLEGALYRITESCEYLLDRYEGFRREAPDSGAYRKIDFRIEATGEECMMYTMNRHTKATPSDTYLAIIRQGYRDWGFNRKKLDRIAAAHGWPSAIEVTDTRPIARPAYPASGYWPSPTYERLRPPARQPRRPKNVRYTTSGRTEQYEEDEVPVNGIGTGNRFPP